MIHSDLLIIDDERRFTELLVRRLNLRGVTCCVRHEGQTGLDILSHNKFTLILLDLQLPDIYGTEVLARIKKICAATPVVILTGHGSEKDGQECLALGAHAFMHKPLDIDALMSILAQIGRAAS
jgi:two-component system response regulator CpxR